MEVSAAIEELLLESFGLINESNTKDILNGKISAPKITKIKVAFKLNISRPQLDKWLSNSKLDFEEQVNHVQDEFYQKLKNKSRLS